jgi:hypothetical protein
LELQVRFGRFFPDLDSRHREPLMSSTAMKSTFSRPSSFCSSALYFISATIKRLISLG